MVHRISFAISFNAIKFALRFHKRNIYRSACLFRNDFSRPSNKFSRHVKEKLTGEEDSTFTNTDDIYSEEDYKNLVDRAFRVNDSGHSVLIIQPYIKWGTNKKRNTTPDLQLAEAVTLIKSLSSWTVVDALTVSLMSLDKTALFGEGNLEKFKDIISSNKRISALFISTNILKGVQRSYLEKYFEVPVFDRYSIVMQIFREHAQSREAKLQLKLAEIPYVRGCVKELLPSHDFSSRHGETYTEFQRNILKEKEKKLKKEIEVLRSQRNLLRRKRQNLNIPVVAVVGYTNAGKTSLIKAITGDDAILPKDVLFATLDITVHAGKLPSGLTALFVDTIGFISDIPTMLLESFVATLEDALLADVILHVRDVSHPDTVAQHEVVNDTLQRLNLNESMMSNIVEVGNKMDLIPDINPEEWSQIILSSAVKLKGIDEIKEAVEDAIIRATGRKRIDIRVRTGGEEYLWLLRESTAFHIRADPQNLDFSIMSVIISPEALAKFTYHFIRAKR